MIFRICVYTRILIWITLEKYINIENFLIKIFFSKNIFENFSTIDHYLLIDVNRRFTIEQNIINFFKWYCNCFSKTLVKRFKYIFVIFLKNIVLRANNLNNRRFVIIDKLFFDSNLKISIQMISRILEIRKTRDSSCEFNRNYWLLFEKLDQKHQNFDVYFIINFSIIV